MAEGEEPPGVTKARVTVALDDGHVEVGDGFLKSRDFEIAQANFGDLVEQLDRPEEFKIMLKGLLRFPNDPSPFFTLDAFFENPLVI